MRNEIKLWLKVIVIAILVQPLYSLASNIGTLTSFTAGTPIQSAQVNGNFAAITTAVNSKQDALVFGGAPLSGSSADAGLTVINTAGNGVGIEGVSVPNSLYSSAHGVVGLCDYSAYPLSAGDCVGVEGDSYYGSGVTGNSTEGNGVTGFSINGTGVGGSGYPGVYGEGTSATSPGVEAFNNTGPTGMALDIRQGYFQVAGAGANTSTTAFLWTATAASKTASPCAGNCSLIDNPMTNGNGNLLLTVTQTLTPDSIYNAHPVGVWYDGAKWEIFNEDNVAMPTNASFNVLVISP